MDNLPYEILQQIILYCDPDDINNLTSVNKLLYNICSDSYIWYKLTQQRFAKLPNYEQDKDYRKIYYNIWYADFTTFDFAEPCVDTFYCTAYIYIKNLHMCESFNKSLFKFEREDDHATFKIFLYLAKQILTPNKYKELLYFRTKCEETILHDIDDPQMTQMILDEIDDKDVYCLTRDDVGQTPLFYSGEEMSLILLNNVQDPNVYCWVQDIYGDTALFCDSGNEKVLLSFVEDKDEYIRHTNKDNETALMKVSNIFSLQILLNDVHNVDNYCSVVDYDGNTVLHLLISKNPENIYQLVYTLLDYVYDVDKFCSIQNRRGNTVFHRLIKNNPVTMGDLVVMMFENILDIDKFCSIQNLEGETALHNQKITRLKSFDDTTKLYTINCEYMLGELKIYRKYVVNPLMYYVLRSVKDLNALLNIVDNNNCTILNTPQGSKFTLPTFNF